MFHLTIVNVAALNRTLCGIGNRRKSYFLTPGIVNSIVSYDHFEIGFQVKFVCHVNIHRCLDSTPLPLPPQGYDGLTKRKNRQHGCELLHAVNRRPANQRVAVAFLRAL